MTASIFQETLTTYFSRIRKVNATGNYPARLPQTAEPLTVPDPQLGTSQVIQELGNTTQKPGIAGQNWIRLVPYGTGTGNQTFNMRLLGWGSIGTHTQAPVQILWVPVLLAEFQVTLGAMPGVAGAIIDNTQNFAKTITLVTNAGYEGVLDAIVSPNVDGVAAHCMVDLRGFQKLEVLFQINSVTDANSLYALF
jgi:hypothetical protein